MQLFNLQDKFIDGLEEEELFICHKHNYTEYNQQ